MITSAMPPIGTRIRPVAGQENRLLLVSDWTNPLHTGVSLARFDRLRCAGPMLTSPGGHHWLPVVGYQDDGATCTGFLAYDERHLRWNQLASLPDSAPIRLKEPIRMSDTSLQVRWENPPVAERVLVRQEGESARLVTLMELAAGGQSYTDTNLKADTSYTYRILGITSAELGVYSNPVRATTSTGLSTASSVPSTSELQPVLAEPTSGIATGQSTAFQTWFTTYWVWITVVGSVLGVVLAVYLCRSTPIKRSNRAGAKQDYSWLL